MASVQLYRPANGSEGADFMAEWCGRCARDGEWGCPIAQLTMAFRIDDPEYPDAWREDGPSGPRCTAFDAIDPFEQPFDPGAAMGLLL